MNTTQECQNIVEEDEIDLRELWQSVKDGKRTIFLTMLAVMTLTFVYVLAIPNSYKSEAVLMPSAQDSSSSLGGLGGLGGLAAMAGVSIGGGSMTPDVAFKSLLNNYSFMKEFVEKNHIYEYYNRDDADKNYVFALGFRGLYDLFHFAKKDDLTESEKNDARFKLIQKLQKKISISADKKSGLITISYTDYDRTYTPKVVNYFLKDASAYLVSNGLKHIDSQLNYFQKEMANAEAIELRKNLSEMISKILQSKVTMQAKEYYQCDLLTAPKTAYIKDKTKPKRGLILVVAFITSMILGIFIVFFRNFLKEGKEEDRDE